MKRLYDLDDTQAVMIAQRERRCPCHLLSEEACECKPFGDSRVWCCDGTAKWLKMHGWRGFGVALPCDGCIHEDVHPNVCSNCSRSVFMADWYEPKVVR